MNPLISNVSPASGAGCMRVDKRRADAAGVIDEAADLHDVALGQGGEQRGVVQDDGMAQDLDDEVGDGILRRDRSDEVGRVIDFGGVVVAGRMTKR